MATRGNSNQIIIGAAQLFVSNSNQGPLEYNSIDDVYSFNSGSVSGYPSTSASGSYADKLEADERWRNVGFTMNGLEVQFQPDFGEVQVDQLLDVAKLYKQGMQVNLATAFAEATLENLLVAIAAPSADLTTGNMDNPMDTGTVSAATALELTSGAIGECPVERGLVAVGPGTGDCDPGSYIERIYVAYRALSIDNVTVSAKRDEPSMFEVSFRLLPSNNGSYGKIVDRTVNSTT